MTQNQSPEITQLLEKGKEYQVEGDMAEAEQCFKAVLEKDPNNAQALFHFAKIGEAVHRYHSAAELMRMSVASDPNNFEAWETFGDLLVKIGESELAIKALTNAIAINPSKPKTHYDLARLKISVNLKEEAGQHLRDAITQDPNFAPGYRMLAEMEDIKVGSDLYKIVKEGSELDSLDPKVRFHLLYALSSIYRNEGNDEAFAEYLFKANALQAECEEKHDRKVVIAERVRTAFTAENMSKASTADTGPFRPIFVIGVPRSGTTLVETILASHTDVEAGDELEHMQFSVAQRLNTFTGEEYPLGFQQLSRDEMNAVAFEYYSRVGPMFPNAKCITDKNLGNYLSVGLIKYLFPEGRIVALFRNPMDSCLSILRRVFNDRMRYCCDIDELAQAHRVYRDMIDYWDTLLPGYIMRIQYEDLVADPEDHIRALLKHCNLEWQDACLNFHESRTTVRTFSALQVRKPLYTSSVGAWKKYGDLLKPMTDALEKYDVPLEDRSN